MSLFRELGEQPELVASLNRLGHAIARHGDYEAARACHEEALSICRKVGVVDRMPQSLVGLADVARLQADDSTAADLYRQALAIAWKLGAKPEVPTLLESLAAVMSSHGDLERAVRLWGGPSAQGSHLGADETDEYRRYIQAARTSLPEDGILAAWTRGQTADTDAIIADALRAAG